MKSNALFLSHRTIPLTRVFSVRNHAKRAAPKTFERALPFAQHLAHGAGCAILAVDGVKVSLQCPSFFSLIFSLLPSDDPGAWDISVRHHVIPISPFQPFNNSHEHLLHVVWLIEQSAQHFFDAVHHHLTSSSPITASLQDDSAGSRALRDSTRPLDKRAKALIKSFKIVEVVQMVVHNPNMQSRSEIS